MTIQPNLIAEVERRRQEAGGRGQEVFFRRGFKPLLKKSHQIFNLVGVLNP
jgi:hypothetical protein